MKRKGKSSEPPAKHQAPVATAAALPMWKKLVFSLVAVLLVLGGIEGSLRLVRFDYQPREKVLWKPTVAGFNGTFEFYIQTEFAPPGYIWLSQPNTEFTDRYGFRRPEIPFKKQEGKIRIAFLGGSTTQGGYRPYPERVIQILNAAVGEDRYEALNVACSSYSTHQSLIALKRWVLERDPDILSMYHGWNDCAVMQDGFQDDVKDVLMEKQPEPSAVARFVGGLRLTRLVGRLVDAGRTGWPSQRVPPERFEANLRAFAEICREAGKPGIIFSRPPWRRDPLPPMDDAFQGYYAKSLQTTNLADILTKVHEIYSGIQREVATAHPGMRLFDASAVVADLQVRERNGEFGPDVRVYQNDGGHLSSFGDQRLAEQLALFLAGDREADVRNYIQSAGYLAAQAEISMAEMLPFDAAYYARRAMAADPGQEAAMQGLIQRAEPLYEFVRLFNEGRWGGTDQDFTSKINKLRTCLQIRPDDFGVLVQIFRVCIYMNKLEYAAAAMSGFRPSDIQQAYQWKTFELQSHLAGQRWPAAEVAALDVLKMNPSDATANSFLASLRQSRGR